MATFKWKCPACGHEHEDGVDGELGPFITVICSACNKVFDDTSLLPEEVTGWNAAIDKAKAELATKATAES